MALTPNACAKRSGGLANVVSEDSGLIAFALDRMADGVDFADALHLGELLPAMPS